MKTHLPKADTAAKKWFIVDAEGKTLGRIASQIAVILRGKHRPDYSTSVDMGDFVVVVNAEKIHATANKLRDKIYYHHSMYPNGLKSKAMGKLLKEQPKKVIQKAVWGMLPKGRLGRDIFKKLKVYTGTGHPHQAQGAVAFKKLA